MHGRGYNSCKVLRRLLLLAEFDEFVQKHGPRAILRGRFVVRARERRGRRAAVARGEVGDEAPRVARNVLAAEAWRMSPYRYANSIYVGEHIRNHDGITGYTGTAVLFGQRVIGKCV